MANRTQAQFKTLYGSSGTLFPDNTTGEISEADVRAQGEDIADSFYNRNDDVLTVGRIALVTIPSASILNSNSSPVTILPAEAGKVIIPLSIVLFLDYNSAAYATNTNFRFEINGVSMSGTDSTLLVSTADSVSIVLPTSLVSTPFSTLVNQPLVFEVQSGNPTAGDSPIGIFIRYTTITSI